MSRDAWVDRATAPAAERCWDDWLERANRDPEVLRGVVAEYRDFQAWVQRMTPDGDPGLLPLRPAIFPQARYEEFLEVSARLIALTETALTLHGDPEGLLREMGLPDAVRRSFGHRQFGLDLSRAFARTDLLLHDGALKVLELNIDSGIGGMVGGSLFTQRYFDSPAGRATSREFPLYTDSPLVAASEFIRKVAGVAGLGRRPFVAVLEWDYHEEIQHAYASVLSQYGLPAAFVRVDALDEKDGYLYVGDRRIDVAIKNFSMGSLDYPEQMGAIERAVAKGGTLVLTDSRSVLSSNKRLLAVLSEHAEQLNGRDRDLIERHVPWSRQTTASIVRYEGEDVPLGDLLAARHRHDFVLKCGSGEGGASVVIGRHASSAQWEAAAAGALASPDYIIQRYEAPDSLTLPFLSEEEDRIVWRRHPFVLGQFVIDRQPGGLFVRFDPNETEGVINFARGAGIVTGIVQAAE